MENFVLNGLLTALKEVHRILQSGRADDHLSIEIFSPSSVALICSGHVPCGRLVARYGDEQFFSISIPDP